MEANSSDSEANEEFRDFTSKDLDLDERMQHGLCSEQELLTGYSELCFNTSFSIYTIPEETDCDLKAYESTGSRDDRAETPSQHAPISAAKPCRLQNEYNPMLPKVLSPLSSQVEKSHPLSNSKVQCRIILPILQWVSEIANSHLASRVLLRVLHRLTPNWFMMRALRLLWKGDAGLSGLLSQVIKTYFHDFQMAEKELHKLVGDLQCEVSNSRRELQATRNELESKMDNSSQLEGKLRSLELEADALHKLCTKLENENKTQRIQLEELGRSAKESQRVAKVWKERYILLESHHEMKENNTFHCSSNNTRQERSTSDSNTIAEIVAAAKAWQRKDHCQNPELSPSKQATEEPESDR